MWHGCMKDCILYHKEFTLLLKCPVCDEKRYEGPAHHAKPRKVFRVFSLQDHIRNMYADPKLAEAIHKYTSAAADRTEADNESMHDICHSPAWKEAVADPNIGLAERYLFAGLWTDGVNPFAKENNNYSMWPFIMNFFGLPSWLRNTFDNVFCWGLVPGPREPKSLQAYLDFFTDELNDLYLEGKEHFPC